MNDTEENNELGNCTLRSQVHWQKTKDDLIFDSMKSPLHFCLLSDVLVSTIGSLGAMIHQWQFIWAFWLVYWFFGVGMGISLRFKSFAKFSWKELRLKQKNHRKTNLRCGLA